MFFGQMQVGNFHCISGLLIMIHFIILTLGQTQ